jgi:hypothetical protein
MKTYAELRNRMSDFIVSYRLYSQNEGGRKVTYQHLRCDFIFEGDDPQKDEIHMIHPEFLDKDGLPITEEVPVPLSGRASMWIIVPEMPNKVYQSRIKIGTRGFFMEGARKIGEVVVDEIVGLYENPAQ